jgi:ABC-type multidrug transport system fused ATPase/permease subunit
MREWLNKAEERSSKYFYSWAYLALFGLAYYLCWYFSSLPGATVVAGLNLLLVLLLSNDARLFTPVVIFCFLSFHKMPFYDSIPLSLYVMAGLVVLALILMFVRRKITGVSPDYSLGAVGFSFLVFVALMFISSFVNSSQRHSDYELLGYFTDFCGLLLVAFYWSIRVLSEKGHEDFTVKEFYAFDVLVCLEVLTLKFQGIPGSDAFITGWGTKNVVAIFLECTMPFVAEIFSKDIRRVDAVALLGLDFYLLFISGSRAGMMTGILLIPLLALIIIARRSTLKWHDSFVCLAAMVCCLGLAFTFIREFRDGIIRFFTMNDDLNGREPIWQESLAYWRLNELVGSSFTGLFEMYPHYFPPDEGIMLCHNTWFTLLASLGILGVLSYLLHLAEIGYGTWISKDYPYKLSILAFILVGLFHGLFDNTFLSLDYMLFYLVIFASPELVSPLKAFKGQVAKWEEKKLKR